MAEPFGYRAAGLSAFEVDHPFAPPGDGRAMELARRMTALGDIRPTPGAAHLVKGWFDQGALSVVFGESNVGKTFLALDVALHVSAGMDWHGARVPGGERWPGWALYIAGEGGGGVAQRIEALRIARPELVEAVERLGCFQLLPMALDLCAGEDAAALCAALEGLQSFPALVVVDTLARALGAGDENSGKDMGALIRNIDMIREATGAHVMLIHHSGKDAAKGARGHSSLRAAADTEVELRRAGEVVTARATKQRDVAALGEFSYRLRTVVLGTDDDGDEITSAVVERCEPVKTRPRLSAQQTVAMQALDDALAQRGEVKGGELFPGARRCVSLDVWREYCDRRSFCGGEADSSAKSAFSKVRRAMQEKGYVCIQDGFVWRVEA